MTGPAPGKRATIRDVAARAGVSVATASRVLSGSDYPVTGRMRGKVLRAVDELDYVANAHARALSGSRPKLIAMVGATMNSPFYADIAQGVASEAAAQDRLCMYASSQGDAESELAIVSLMRQQQADAVILMGGVVPTEEYDRRMAKYAANLTAAGSRLVLCGRPGIGPGQPAIVVGYDNAEGAAAITSHLASYGHRRILHLAGASGNTTAAERVDGYRSAVRRHGLDPDPGLVVHGGFNRESGHRNVAERLRANGGRPDYTAIFAADDSVASGAMRALREAGVSLPAEVSIVGYNDSIPAKDLSPLLTTVHIPADELGRTAVRLALAPVPPTEPVLLGTHIVVRDSVTHPPTV
ncbi:LacI family transcriptional regulator [Stackebrandtia albiflava]|uniref:LacI family transcriptional regulator n=1 Tax=Stackebrandtia albiflava TaxID=406432 RepID=A0A562UYL5_9ACTN|nr:LacI family DNA-binding transcriptional regulator [Stackebrandtia albiflava]TWJ10731.1 LacI family transcriptional regulator [Stackebrandtia albiflava]